LSLKVEEGKKALAQREKELREQAEPAKKRVVIFLLEESWSRWLPPHVSVRCWVWRCDA
jgi:hypothetical protein